MNGSWRNIIESRRKHRKKKEETTDKYRALDKQVKSSCKADKKAWLIQTGTEAQEAAQRNDSKTLFRIVRELTGMQSNSNIPVKDKSGKILMTEEEQKARWVEQEY